MGLHMFNGYTTNKTYNAAYNEVMTEISKISSTANVENINMVKCIESNETGLTLGGFYVSVKFKEQEHEHILHGLFSLEKLH